MLTVELLPDAELIARVQEARLRLARAGLSSMAVPGEAPRVHVTLAVAGGLPAPAVLGRALAALPLPVRTCGLHVAGGAHGGLAVPIVASPALIAMHGAVWAMLDAPVPRHAPGRWLPHLGLALRMTAAERAAAIRLLADLPDLTGELVTACSYDTDARATRRL